MYANARDSCIVVVDKDLSLAGDFVSTIIDFHDSSHGSIHAIWTPSDSTAGVFVLHGSLVPAVPTSFDDNDVDKSDFVLVSPLTSHLWTYKKLSFRYMQMRWTANATTTGTVTIYAQGKRF